MNDLDKLYSAVSAQFDIGDVNSFKSKMQTPEDRKRFYDAVSAQGYDLGDYNQYESRLGKMSGVSGTGSLNTSLTLGEPTQNSSTSGIMLPKPDGTYSAPVSASISEDNVADSQGTAEANQVVPESSAVAIPGDSSQRGYVDVPESLKAFYEMNPSGRSGQVVQDASVIQEPQELTLGQSIENSLYNVGTQLMGFDDRLKVMAADTYERVLGKEQTKNWYANSGRDIEAERIAAYEELNRLSEYTRPTFEFLEGVEQGSVKQVLGGAINAISSLAATAAVSIPTGGAGIFTEQIGQYIVDFNNAKAADLGISVEELYEQGLGEFGTPTALGVISGGLEFAGLEGAGKVLTNSFKNKAFKAALEAGWAWNAEGTTEALQGGVDKVAEEMANGNTDKTDLAEKFVDTVFSKEGFRAYINGVVATSGAAGLGKMVGGVKTDQAKNVLQKSAERVQVLQNELSKQNLPESTRTILNEQLSGEVENVATAFEQDVDAQETLSTDDKRQIEELTSKKEELQSVVDDPNVSPETKAMIEPQITDLSAQINEVINPKPPSIDQLSQEVQDSVAPKIERIQEIDGRIKELRDNNQLGGQEESDLVLERRQLYSEINLEVDNADIQPVAPIEATQATEITEPVDSATEQTESVTEEQVQPQEQTTEPVEFSEGEQAERVIEFAPLETEIEVQKNEQTQVNEPQLSEQTDSEIEQITETQPVENRKAPYKPMSEFSTPEEYSRYIAENSNDPNEIAKEWIDTQQYEPDYIESQIVDYLGSRKINIEDYRRYGDVNNLTGSKKSRWIDSKNSGISLDVAAQELSERLGTEVSPAEFVDVIDKYKGIQDFKNKAKNPIQVELERKYKELTGKNLNNKIAERAVRQFNESLTDKEIFEANEDLKELGITYQDILNYEEFNRQTVEGNSESLQQSTNEQSGSSEDNRTSNGAQKSTDKKQIKTTAPKVKPKTPRALLKGIADKLSGSGLIGSVTLTDSQGINTALGVTNGEDVNGYVDSDGNIVINQDKAGADTPIHEAGHLWESAVEKQNPELHARGIELIRGEEGKPYVDYVKRTQPNLTEDAMYKEALAQAIGDNGSKLIGNFKQGKIKDWLQKAWDWIGQQVGISGMTANQIANMNLQQFSDAVAIDLLQGNPIREMGNGDIVIPAEATKTGDLDASQQKINAFLEKMRNRNNVKYQGNIDNRLSPQDLVEFLDVAQELTKIGQVSTLGDLRQWAKGAGITSELDIRSAWAVAKEFSSTSETFGAKRSKINVNPIIDDYGRMTVEQRYEASKALIDQGIIDPDQMVSSLIVEPSVLEDFEIYALNYHLAQLESEMDEQSLALRDDPMNANARMEQIRIHQKIEDTKAVMALAGQRSGRSLNAFNLEVNPDYSVAATLRDMVQVGDVDAETRARIEQMGEELNKVMSELRLRTKELENLQKQGVETGINQQSQVASKTKPRTVTRNARAARADAISTLDALDLSSFGLASPQFQANNTIRFSVSGNSNLNSALGEAVAKMKADIESGTRLDDALETAIESVNKTIGKGKWNEVAFRSAVINGYTDKGHTSRPRKPYIAKSGKPVIPGRYINDLVTDFRNRNGEDITIDQIVETAQKDLGDSVSSRDIRDSITGYGKATQNSLTDDQKNISTAKSIGRLMSRLEDLENLGYSPTSMQKKAREVNDEIKDLRQAIKNLSQSLIETPEYKAQMEQIAEEKALARKKQYIEDYIKQVEDRIDTYRKASAAGVQIPDGYFSKKPKYDFSTDPEIIGLERRREEIRNKLKAEKYRHELVNRGTVDKVIDFFDKVIFNPFRALTAGADLSSLLIQGGLITLSDPKTSFASLKKSLKNAGSENLTERYFIDLQRKPFFEIAREAKLAMQLPQFYETIREEQLGSNNIITRLWERSVDKALGNKSIDINKLPIVGLIAKKGTKVTAQDIKDWFPYTAADRQYAMFLSDIRYTLFEKTVVDAQNYFGLDPKSNSGKEMTKKIASAINDATLATRISALEGAPRIQKAMSWVFFSARKLAASWVMLPKLGYYGANAAMNATANRFIESGKDSKWAQSTKAKTEFNAFLFKKLYGRYAGVGLGTAVLTAMIPTLISSMLHDDDDEEKPFFYNPQFFNATSSDFMKLRHDNTRVDLLLGMGGNATLIGRALAGGYTTSSDPIFRKFGEQSSYKTNETLGGIMGQYMLNKLAPAPSILVNKFLMGEMQKAEANDRIAESWYPMWVSGAFDQYEQTRSVSNALSMAALGVLGVAANTYGGVEFADPRGTNNAEARKVFEKLQISDYSPVRKSKNMYSEESKNLTKLQDADYAEEYKTLYNEYMTQATLSQKVNISNPKLSPAKIESLVGNMKADANKYAEIKSTGVYIDEAFRTVRDSKGNLFKLTNDQLHYKVDLIKNFMNSTKANGALRSAQRDVIKKLRKEGKAVSKEIVEMDSYVQLYNAAARNANSQMTKLLKQKVIEPIPQFEYDKQKDSEGEYSDRE